MRVLTFALLFLLALPAFAADFSPERIKRDIEEAQVINAKLLKVWAKHAKLQVNTLRGKARIEAKAALARMEKLQPPVVPLFFGPYNAEDWGVLYDCKIKVVQIVDDNSLIGRTIDDEEQLVWVKGYDTSDLTDEDAIQMKSNSTHKDHAVVKITTTKYETLLGQRTVLLIEPFDVAPYAELAWSEKEKPTEKAATKTASAKRNEAEGQSRLKPGPRINSGAFCFTDTKTNSRRSSWNHS